MIPTPALSVSGSWVEVRLLPLSLSYKLPVYKFRKKDTQYGVSIKISMIPTSALSASGQMVEGFVYLPLSLSHKLPIYNIIIFVFSKIASVILIR